MGGVTSPRGADFSADGNTMYLADYAYNTVSVWNKIVGVRDELKSLPKTFSLGQNYPNPFNPATQIPFEISKSGVIKLVVYDLLGRQVRVVENQWRVAGQHTIEFNASGMASGAYIYRLTVDNQELSRKMMYLK